MTATAIATKPVESARSATANLRLHYQGWSGCVIEAPATPRTPALAIDPAPGGELPRTELVVLITHGHPEHIQGARDHVALRDRAPVTVIGSANVCRFLKKYSTHVTDRFHEVAGGGRVEAGGWRVRVFAWKHMSLIPPDFFLALRHISKLFLHPLRFTRIALDSAFGPRHAPMLGFCVTPPDGAMPFVYYGEGLHRLTEQAELRQAFGETPIGALITAVEPEDTQQLPAMLAPHGIRRILAFEAHRIWREQFGLPQIDLPDLLQRFKAGGMDGEALAPGQSTAVFAPSPESH